jgi:aminomethyltransferase
VSNVAAQAEISDLALLPLDALHRARGAKFAPFAGYKMPVQYEGVIAEHKWTRAHAGLFDVSHMGPCFLVGAAQGAGAHGEVARLVERIVPADIAGLKPGQVRYTTLLNGAGGVLDDLMIARPREAHLQGTLHIVVNAAMKMRDFALLSQAAASGASLRPAEDGASLLALQGPEAGAALADIVPAAAAMGFMSLCMFDTEQRFGRLFVTRSGYTGEDGFEILVGPRHAGALAARLLDDDRVKLAGLGARDTLRLEAGLCLYGHELDPTISPIEAGLGWTIQKRRRQAGDFPGAARILAELKSGPARLRVGIAIRDRAPAREGAEIFKDGRRIGAVTSGGFSPMLNAPISMGYVEAAFAAPGTGIDLMVRGIARPGAIVALPFVPHRYAKDRA